MKVKKLIKILEKQDPEAEAILKVHDESGTYYGKLILANNRRKGLLIFTGVFFRKTMAEIVWKLRK